MTAARSILSAALLLFPACAESVDTAGLPPTYTGTVVDAETAAPIEAAVVVIEWEKCGIVHMDGCGLHHTIRETVTDSSGAFSVDPIPEVDWNPFTVLHRLWVLIYAVDYLPLWTNAGNLPGLGGFLDSELQRGLGKARISLSRSESDSALRLKSDISTVWILDGGVPPSALPQLRRAVDEQRQRIAERARERRD